MSRKIKISVICILLVTGLLFLVSLYSINKFTPYINEMPLLITKKIEKNHSFYVPITSINQYLSNAVIASQDKRFYQNSGIDTRGTFRALYYTIFKGQRQGASTITEQLAKNVFFQDHDSLRSDIETKTMALLITKKYSKDKILEMYFNDIYYGNGAYGLAAASKSFFKTSPQLLTLGQSAFLAALINAPSYYATHHSEATNRAAIILNQMKQNNFITQNQLQTGLQELTAP